MAYVNNISKILYRNNREKVDKLTVKCYDG